MIHVAIDARLPDKGQGGVQQVIRSLAEGFCLIETPNTRRSWIVLSGTKWWEGVFPDYDRLIVINPPLGRLSMLLANRAPKLVSRIYPLFSRFRSHKPLIDKQLRELQVDLIHMTFQDGFITDLPYIYHPHDLQHEYFPQYFRQSQITHRNSVWKSLAANSEIVMAASELIMSDLVKFWGISEKKIKVLPIPPPSRFPTPSRVRNVCLKPYVIYPAVFWPHKNHLTLILAINQLRQDGVEVHCVLTGATGTEFIKIKHLVKNLGLNHVVHFRGHVTDQELTDLIIDSVAVVIPSLHEAFSLTAWDAYNLSIPVLMADIPSFRKQFGNEGHFFPPTDYRQLALSIKKYINSDGLSANQSANGWVSALHFSPKDLATSIEETYQLLC